MCLAEEATARGIDLRAYPELLDRAGAILSAGCAVQIRPEKGGLAVMEEAQRFRGKFSYCGTPSGRDGPARQSVGS